MTALAAEQQAKKQAGQSNSFDAAAARARCKRHRGKVRRLLRKLRTGNRARQCAIRPLHDLVILSVAGFQA